MGLAMTTHGYADWTEPPAFLVDFLRRALGEVRSSRCRALHVDAHESSLLELCAEVVRNEGAERYCAAVKQYTDGCDGRVESDALVLRALRDHGARVPSILGTIPDHSTIVLEWFDPRTLASALKEGQPIGRNTWSLVMTELANVHNILNLLWGGGADIPRWAFAPEERRLWALEGWNSWQSWLPVGDAKTALERLYPQIDDLAGRLARPELSDSIIWGDCNPKNILLRENDIRFIDFQIKRSSPMLDLVLLFTFADSPATYLPRHEAHELLGVYWDGRQTKGPCAGLDRLLAWYDDELIWRILVYGGMLLRKREQRLACWRDVCTKMALDLPEAVSRRTTTP